MEYPRRIIEEKSGDDGLEGFSGKGLGTLEKGQMLPLEEMVAHPERILERKAI